jgi:curved DNA-binding protein
MASRDYYDILGVARSANADAIRSAHRKLALQHHPDRNKSKDAPAKFAEIQQAYEVLSDDDKRRQYDEFIRLGGSPGAFGSTAGAGQGGAGQGGAGQSGYSGPFGAGATGAGGGSWNSADTQTFESIFGDMFGGSRAGGGRASRGPRARPRERMQYDVQVPLETVLRGGKQPVSIEGERFELDIRAGMDDEDLVSIPGKLDAVVRVHVADHPWLTRNERDLSFDLPISIVEATLGATIDVPLPVGGTVALKIPPGTASGKKMRIGGRGFPAVDGRPAGDLYVVIQIVPPKEPNELTRSLLKEIGSSLDNPRARIAHLRP